ncbi:MAG: universal stress protein [Flavobacteriaceae bacterium]|nr:universal stress protein [Flavobacteriaceae bacterium]
MKKIKNILVAVDFNDNIGDLLGYADSIATKFGSKVWLIHVSAPDPDFVGYEPGPQYIRDSRAEELKDEHRRLQDLRKTFLSENLKSEALLIQGSTVETVLEEAKKLNSDLLIVGTHKYGFIQNIFLESVSLKLFKNANIPFLAIPIKNE